MHDFSEKGISSPNSGHVARRCSPGEHGTEAEKDAREAYGAQLLLAWQELGEGYVQSDRKECKAAKQSSKGETAKRRLQR